MYTALVEHRRERGHRANLAEIRATAREDLPLVTSTLVPVLVLIVGATGLIERDTAVTLATIFCLTELFLVGALLEREEGGSAREVLVSGLISSQLRPRRDPAQGADPLEHGAVDLARVV